ncbi:lysine--tRNA ligase [Candidatus Woesearchaeota archaeon]|nr:lysine--tRNA ligase [Candidatus Woesearchaeota archaeon]
MQTEESLHWADQIARKVVQTWGKKKEYVCAAGITPSGTVHIGNFREMITVDLVVRALRDLKHNVRFVYSWDDFDVFRKVPANMPSQDFLNRFLRHPITEVPDTLGCHKSYAEHNEKEVEDVLPKVGIQPEFLYQHKKYQRGDYAEEIKHALAGKEKIKAILDKFRAESHPEGWIPLSVYCEKCRTDNTKITGYDGSYTIAYSCACGHSGTMDFRRNALVKLPWRIDWPMRWHFEKVDFEPGGKEHSTEGGSYTTAKEIVKEVFGREPPIYHKYDFIIIKGKGGKMSSSKGNVITLKEALGVYEPEIVRYVFASTRPDTEFAISFDLDVLKVYEDYDKCERINFKKEAVSEKDFEKQKRIYELSQVNEPPAHLPFQPSIKHLLNLIQLYGGDEKKILDDLKGSLKTNVDAAKVKARLGCAGYWLEHYAPEDMKFHFHTKQEAGHVQLSEKEKDCLKKIAGFLKDNGNISEDGLHNQLYEIAKASGIEPKDFFRSAYRFFIGKERGPKLANLILTAGKEKILDVLSCL